MSPEGSGSSCDEDDLLPDHGGSSSSQLPMGPSANIMVNDPSGLLKQLSPWSQPLTVCHHRSPSVLTHPSATPTYAAAGATTIIGNVPASLAY